MDNGRRRERPRGQMSESSATVESEEKVLEAIEKAAHRKRQNQQLTIYLLICCTVALAWLLGTWHMSFFYVFCLVVLIFFVWKGKVLALTEEFIREKQLLIHRKRALKQNETTEWLNFIINRWWVFSASTISDIVKKKIDPLLMDVMPSYLESLELESLSLGEKTPFIKFIQVYECMDGVGGGKRPLSLSAIMHPPPGLQQAHKFQLVLEVDAGVICDEFLMIFQAKFARSGVGGVFDIAVEKLSLSGLVQMIVRLDMDAPFPHVASLSVSFLEKPDVSFSMRMLKVISPTDVPFLRSWIYHLVMNGITEALVDPGKLDFTTTSTGPTKILSKPTHQPLEKSKKEKSSANNRLDLMDDSRFCVVNIGKQESRVQITSRTEPWTHSDSFLVYDTKKDKLMIDVKSQVLLTTQSVANFEMLISSLIFNQNPSSKIPLTKSLDDNETLKLELSSKYTPLPDVEKSIEQGSLATGASDSVGGVVYICLHSASNVLGLDSNGKSDPTSDPYCVIYIGGKKLKCTHYVPRTRNPKWEVSAEVIVKDISKAVISFVVYDWDGRSSSEDDFLGSAHVMLSEEKPMLKRKILNLGCHLATQDSDDGGKLGTICFTAVFMPIADVRPDDVASSQSISRQHSIAHSQISTVGNKSSKSRKNSSIPSGISGTVDIEIKQAKELVAMDRNGFSDPFCEIKVGGRKRFVTSVKKKTLNPVWDERFMTDLPKQNETLEIIVWDQDLLFQKDFLGSLSFTLQDLTQHSTVINNDGWFTLQRINSGKIQLRFKVDPGYDPRMFMPIENNNSSITSRESENLASSNPESTTSSTMDTAVVKQIPGDSVSLHDVKTDEKNGFLNQTPKQSGTFPRVRKTASESTVDGSTMSGQRKDQPGAKSAENSVVDDGNGLPNSDISTTDFYCGVRGHILGVTGLQSSVSHAYFKLRLVSPINVAQGKPSAGTVIAKSAEFHTAPNVKLDVKFEVDHGRGVHRRSLLMFDLKSGRYSHIAVQGFTLEELFKKEGNEWWLDMENNVKMHIKMSYESLSSTGQLSNAHRTQSLLGSFRTPTLRRIKEQ